MNKLKVLTILLMGVTSSFSESTLSLFGALDVGKVMKGNDARLLLESEQQEYEPFFSPENGILQRNYVNVSLHHRFGETHAIDAGIGGLFWKGREQVVGLPGNRQIQFGPGVSHLYVTNQMAEDLRLRYGYFSYKYNEAAKNLGEYFFRSEAYPVVIYTGGWSWVNAASHSSVGAQLSWSMLDGALTHDFLVLMEYFNAPVFDVTPAYVVKWKPNQVVTIGGGVSWHRGISLNNTSYSLEYYKDKEIPGQPGEAILRPTNVNLERRILKWQGDESVAEAKEKYYEALTRGERDIIKLSGINSPEDLELDIEVTRKATEGKTVTALKEDVIEEIIATNGDTATNLSTLPLNLSTLRSMLFFNIDLNRGLGMPREYGLFNFYGEVALLGFQDYDLFYTSKTERLPVMLGLSVPTFLLDHLSFEAEYLKNPHPESTYGFLRAHLAPDPEYRKKSISNITSDDFKWSVHASKKMGSALTLYLQFANDHFRLKDDQTNPIEVPITNQGKHWYWLARLQWSL